MIEGGKWLLRDVLFHFITGIFTLCFTNKKEICGLYV